MRICTVRSKEEIQQAADAHLNGAMMVNDDGSGNLTQAVCLRLISVPGIDHLSHGHLSFHHHFQRRSFGQAMVPR